MFNRDKRKIISDITPRGPRPAVPKEILPPRLPKIRRGPLGAPRARMSRKWLIGALVVLAVLGIGFYIYRTASLTLIIKPKRSVFDLGSGIKITLSAKAFSTSVTKRGEGTSQDTKQFNNRATGTIIVYNNYNQDPQTLVAGTRFQLADGRIYRSKNRVVVPGKSGDTPGSMEVMIEAGEPGEKYNSDLTDFTIPGFAGTPKYQKFYGRSKTPLAGGASGQGKVVGKSEAEALLMSLEDDIQKDLKNNLLAAIPSDYTPFPKKIDAAVTSRITDPPVGFPGEKFFGEVRGEAKTLALQNDTFSGTLATLLFKDTYKQGAYHLDQGSDLSFKNINFDYTQNTVTFSLEGRAVFDWILDRDTFRSQVLAQPDEPALKNVFASYPAIARVEAVFTPSFLKKIPHNPTYLIIKIEP